MSRLDTEPSTPRPPAEYSQADPNRQGATTSAGRGGIALSGGKIFFLVMGLIQQIVLKAILGLSGYGALSTTLSIASIAYNPMVQSGIQGVSRQTAGLEPEERPRVFRRILQVHLLVSLGLAMAFLLLAPLVARALGAPHIESGVRALAGVLFVYGMYASLVGYLNGQRRFLAQAGLDAFAAALRTVGLLGGAYLSVCLVPDGSASVLGTCLGFLVAACLVFLGASRLTGYGGKGGQKSLALAPYLRMLRHIWAGQILLNLLFQADALLLRRFAADAASVAQLPEAVADPYVGAYRATQLFCFLPFQLLTSVTFVLFPLLAQANAEKRTGEVARLVRRGLRLCVLATGFLVCVLVARPEGLLELVFGRQAAQLGGSAMRILAIGMGAFAVLGVLTSALNSLGLERVSLAVFFVATVLVGIACVTLVWGSPLDRHMLERTALGTTLALLVTTSGAAVVAKRLVGGTIGPMTTVRTATAVGVSAWLVATMFPSGLLWTLLSAPATCLLYLLIQIALRELKRDDYDSLVGLLRK